MTDIIVTLPKNKELWPPTSDDEIKETWDSWDIKSVLPVNFYEKNRVWIYHRGLIKSYCTVDRLEYNSGLPKDSTLLKIWFKSYVMLDIPVKPNYPIRRAFDYTKVDWTIKGVET